MKPPKTLIRIGVVLLAFVAAVLAVRAVFNFTEGRALTRALAELKAKGIPLTARELAPPCPDGENAARLWKAAENLVVMEAKENHGLLARAWKVYSSGEPLDPAVRASLRDLVVKNEKVFGIMTEMGGRPCFLYRDPEQILVEARLPNAVKMIRATELLLFSALFMAEDGDMPGAVERILAGLRFAPLISREGALMPYLIAVAQSRVLANFLGDVCRGRAIAEGDLARLMAALDPGPWSERLAGAVRGERVFFVEAGQLALSGGGGLKAFFGNLSILQKLGLWTIRPLLKRDFRRSLPIYDTLEAWAARPYPENRAALKSESERIAKRPWYAYISGFLISNFESAFLKAAQLEAISLAARTGLACRLYKTRTGRYPESLDELVPGILAEAPVDPFTGKPLVYRREGEGFIVYSLGSNQKDDGGRSTYMITQLVMDKDDDWSWKEDR